jgi:hypothetical protein
MEKCNPIVARWVTSRPFPSHVRGIARPMAAAVSPRSTVASGYLGEEKKAPWRSRRTAVGGQQDGRLPNVAPGNLLPPSDAGHFPIGGTQSHIVGSQVLRCDGGWIFADSEGRGGPHEEGDGRGPRGRGTQAWITLVPMGFLPAAPTLKRSFRARGAQLSFTDQRYGRWG